MASLFDGTKELEGIGEIYRRMTMNCPNPSSMSKRLWELRQATQDGLTRARKALKRFDIGSRIDGLSMSLDGRAFPDWFEELPFADGADVRASCAHGELTDTGQKIREAFEALHSVFPDPEGTQE